MADEESISGNGSTRKVVTRILETLVMAAIVGGLTVWGNSKIMEVKLEHMCDSVSELKSSVKTLFDITAGARLDNVRQEQQINSLMDKLDSHTRAPMHGYYQYEKKKQ